VDFPSGPGRGVILIPQLLREDADFRCMGGTAAFADFLDQELRGFSESRDAQDAHFLPRYIPPHPLLFATPYRPFRASTYRAVPGNESTSRRPAPAQPASKPPRPDGSTYRRPATARPAPMPARPARTLSDRQRQALTAFVELGARLTADYTAGELRSAYRRLALEYHPDRHPGSTESQKARLTRILADLNEHQRHLAAALRAADLGARER